MTQSIFVRQLADKSWQWRLYDSDRGWLDRHYYSGGIEALCEAVPSNVPLQLVVDGQNITATDLELDASQKKHAAKLVPYELEDEIITPVDQLHFAITQTEEGHTQVLYAVADHWRGVLDSLSAQQLDVHTVLPDYLLIQRAEGGITFLLENGVLYCRCARYDGFAVEKSLAPMVLHQFFEQEIIDLEGVAFHLFAELDSGLSELKGLLPERLLQAEGAQIETQLGNFWDLLDAGQSARALNLRRGAFARQLPIKRWWQSWRAPSVYLGIAFIAALAVFVGQYFSYKAQEKAVLSEMQAVYKKAVPNGRPGDPEGVLTSMLRGVQTDSSEPSNFMFLLSKVTEALSSQEKTTLSSYSYNGDQRNLQLTLEFASLSDVGDFRAKLEELGIKADSPRTNSTGGGYQARMRVEEAN